MNCEICGKEVGESICDDCLKHIDEVIDISVLTLQLKYPALGYMKAKEIIKNRLEDEE